MRKLEKVSRKVNDAFLEHLHEAMFSRFNIEVESRFDFFGTMSYISERKDEKPFTTEQSDFLVGFSEGYGKVLTVVRSAAHLDDAGGPW